MPGSLPTSARRCLQRRLNNVDLPTLGRPRITMRGRLGIKNQSIVKSLKSNSPRGRNEICHFILARIHYNYFLTARHTTVSTSLQRSDSGRVRTYPSSVAVSFTGLPLLKSVARWNTRPSLALPICSEESCGGLNTCRYTGLPSAESVASPHFGWASWVVT